MKTQVVQLDSHDDIISTRDKLGWKQTGRILLVWPRKGRILTRRFDLVLLARHSASLGAQIALVTSDPEVRSNARSLGVRFFKTQKKPSVNAGTALITGAGEFHDPRFLFLTWKPNARRPGHLTQPGLRNPRSGCCFLRLACWRSWQW